MMGNKWQERLSDNELGLYKMATQAAIHGIVGSLDAELVGELVGHMGVWLDSLTQKEEPEPAPDDPTSPLWPEVRLDVPYSSQHEVDAKKFTLDCGGAAVEMVGEFYRGQVQGVGTDQIQSWMTGGVNRTTTAENLILALSHFYQVKASKHYDTTMSMIREQIDLGRPGILLVQYGDVPLRMDLGYTAGHWIVFAGYDTVVWSHSPWDRILIHDPDWWQDLMVQGAYLPYTENLIKRAMSRNGRLAIFTGV